MNEYVKVFQKQKYTLVKNFIPKDTAEYLFNYLRLSTHIAVATGTAKPDPQVPMGFHAKHGDMAMETLMKMMKPKMEEVTGLELWPTYTYTRLYKPGDDLKKHTDRPSCEISVTVMIGSDGTPWPIYMDGTKINLQPGDAAIYLGCEVEHWREEFKGDWHAQTFLHYVDKNGLNKEWARDKRIFYGTIKQ
jgi:hypothetical protein